MLVKVHNNHKCQFEQSYAAAELNKVLNDLLISHTNYVLENNLQCANITCYKKLTLVYKEIIVVFYKCFTSGIPLIRAVSSIY